MIENITDPRILKDGFAMPRFKDGIMVILLGDKIIFYRMIILLFYLLGVYRLRFFQFSERYFGYLGLKTFRIVEFVPREWHPLSFVEEIIFGILLLFSESKSVSLKVHDMIVVDIDEKGNAYIREIIR